MHVAELGAGAGYTTELLARAVAPDGVVDAENPDLFIKNFLKDSWPARLSTVPSSSASDGRRPIKGSWSA